MIFASIALIASLDVPAIIIRVISVLAIGFVVAVVVAVVVPAVVVPAGIEVAEGVTVGVEVVLQPARSETARIAAIANGASFFKIDSSLLIICGMRHLLFCRESVVQNTEILNRNV